MPLVVCLFAAASILTLSFAAGQRGGSGEVAALLARIGDRVERYYARAQSVMCQETVRLQPMASDFAPAGRARELVYELRVAWDPAPSAAVPPEPIMTRQIRTVDGRPPRPGDEPRCADPQPLASEPLSMFLAGRRERYVFSWVGVGRVDRRPTLMLDYKMLDSQAPDIKWRGECFSISLQTQGRVWIDAANEDVVRLDERLVRGMDVRRPREQVRANGGSEWFNVERFDSSFRYHPVNFHDPDEAVMLPESIETIAVLRGDVVQRLRSTHVFSKYQRFLTEGRVVR